MKPYLLRSLLAIIVLMIGTNAWCQSAAPALYVPGCNNWYNEKVGGYEISFNTYQYINGEEVNVTVNYSINGGDYQTYSEKNYIMVYNGDTFSYYASQKGYEDSPVTTVTVTASFWQTMELVEGMSDSFWRETDEVLSLDKGGPFEGFRWITSEGGLISQRLSTPDENINENFKLNGYGLVSAEDRIYAYTGLTAGQVLAINVYKGEGGGGVVIIKPEKAPKKGPRRVINGDVTPAITAIEGMELDMWNSYDTENDTWKNYYFLVTAKDGTVKFKAAADAAIESIGVMAEHVPYEPEFELTSANGANRTYKITLPAGATTLYYTTAVANEAPAIGSDAYSSTTDNSVQVTVTGVGNLYAYATNTAGASEIASQPVNGVVQTLNAPTIYSKSQNGDQWTVTLSDDQYELDGSPESSIYYRIGDGAETLYQEAFAVPDGATLSFWAVAEGYTTSPVVTVKATAEPKLKNTWSENYTYWYSSGALTLGDEVETGLYQLKFGGNVLSGGHLLTPDENINSSFMMTYYSGISSHEERTYAIGGLHKDQYLYIYSYVPVTPIEKLELDTWNSTSSCAHLKVTADGTVKFRIAPDHTLREISLFNIPEDGDVVVADANGNRLSYHYENPTSPATLTGISSYATDESKAGRIIIADEVTDSRGNTHEVRYIGGSLDNRSGIVSVVFGKNITCVGGPQGSSNNAFSSCTKLESVTLNAQLDTLGSYAFAYCSALKSIDFSPATSLRVVKGYCFYNSGLEELTVNSDIESLSTDAFYGCSSVQTITYNGTSVPGSFFTSQSGLRTINIGRNVKSIGDRAFQYNTKVTAINIAPDVSDLVIGKYAFYNIDSLRTVTLPAGVVAMGSYVFGSCDSLRTVEFSQESTMTAIPEYCFSYCPNLQTLTLPNSIQTIGQRAFYDCENLREITFGTGLATNGFASDSNLFGYCSNMQQMTLPGVNFPFQCTYSHLPSTMLLFVHPEMVETYKSNSYTKNYHIMAIGSTTHFDVVTTEGGQLPTRLPAEVAGNALTLTVTGPINGTDINQIHELMPFLEVLDLKNAQIVAGGEDYYRYSVSNNKATRQTSYHYATEDDAVGQYMFYNMPNLKRLSLPTTATAMAGYAVASNGKLTQVDMPAQLTSIGERAFYNDSKLEKADIPDGVTRIEPYTFYNCDALTTVTLPDDVTYVGSSAFYDCDGLTTVTLSDAVTCIDSYAFYSCDKLQTINIPAQVETIAESAFAYSSRLASPVVIPATCKTIGANAFYDDSQLPGITLHEGLESIGNYAFYNCKKIPTITLPQSLSSLGTYAFYNCQALKHLTFPANIKRVPDYVLYYCTSLESVTLAEGTTQIGNGAFYGCQKLATVERLDQTTLTSLGSNAFYNTALTSVTLPNSITSMGGSVFCYCSLLESANIPTAITSVPENTFQYCEKLTSVTMHDGIVSLGANAFYGCKLLPALQLNDQIQVIPNYAFYNCESLVLTSLPAQLTSIGSYAFYNTKAITASLTLPETLTTLRARAFSGSGITGITIQNNLSTFDTEVFYECKSLAAVSLPQNMTNIPNYTFYGTTALQTITLPTALKEIGHRAFYGSGLTEISLPNTLQTIGEYAFYNTQITEIKVPKNVTSVGGYFAAGCKQLKKAYLGRKQNYTNNSYFNYFAGSNNLELLRVHAGTPPAISTSTVWMGNTWTSYTGYRTNCVLEVPEGQVDIYKATATWKDFKEIRAFESDDMLNDADYAMMKQLYESLGGASWAKPWDLGSQRHSIGKWQGVTTEVDAEDDELFYITGIDLANQGLVGKLPKSVFSLSKLKTLNLSHNEIEAKVDTLLDNENTCLETVNMEGNHLKGDLYPLASKMPNVTKLNVRYNWLNSISQPIAHDKLDNNGLQRGYQFIDWKTKTVNVPQELYDDVVVNLTLGDAVSLGDNVSFQTYRHGAGDFNYSFASMSRLYTSGSSLTASSTELSAGVNGLWNISSANVFKAPRGVLTAYTYGYQNSYYYDYSYDYITFIFRLDWKDGDVNADQTVDVADLQSVVYYALNESKPGGQAFNFTAADANGDSRINVSDIVGSVTCILNYEDGEPAVSPARMDSKVETRNLIVSSGSSVVLANADEVAALQLTVSGAQQSQLLVAQELSSRFTVSMRNVGGGVRLVIYSPAGNTLAPGESLLLSNLPADAVVTDACLVDSSAARLSVGLDSSTSVNELLTDDQRLQTAPVYDLSGRRVGKWNTLPAGIYIVSVNGKQFKVRK